MQQFQELGEFLLSLLFFQVSLVTVFYFHLATLHMWHIDQIKGWECSYFETLICFYLEVVVVRQWNGEETKIWYPWANYCEHSLWFPAIYKTVLESADR